MKNEIVMTKNLIIDNPVVSNIVFFPRKTPVPKSLPANVKILKLSIVKNIIIGGIFCINDATYPTILLFHGNGELALDYLHFTNFFFDCKVNLAVVDFRGYGFSTGEPYYTSLLTDALPVYGAVKDWLINHDFNVSIFVEGRSLGSACASEIGAKNPSGLKGVIFESGFASVFNMMTRLFRVSSPELTPKLVSQYSNDIRLQNFTKPVLIIHGTSDWIIPISEAELIYNNLPNSVDKTLIKVQGAGHNDIFNYTIEFSHAMMDFILKYG
jgi:pimeloyl-ACP methyl ester carboxylesterase